MKFIFLDRDGVINRERGDYTYSTDHLEILNVGDSLKKLTEKSFRFVVITNQSGIAKGRYHHEDVHKIHLEISKYLKDFGVEILEYFYCPHHPDYTRCICRKPDSVLFEKAIAKYGVDVSRSYMIGDKERDIIPAEKCGIKGFLIDANQSWENVVKKILDHE